MQRAFGCPFGSRCDAPEISAQALKSDGGYAIMNGKCGSADHERMASAESRRGMTVRNAFRMTDEESETICSES